MNQNKYDRFLCYLMGGLFVEVWFILDYSILFIIMRMFALIMLVILLRKNQEMFSQAMFGGIESIVTIACMSFGIFMAAYSVDLEMFKLSREYTWLAGVLLGSVIISGIFLTDKKASLATRVVWAALPPIISGFVAMNICWYYSAGLTIQ